MIGLFVKVVGWIAFAIVIILGGVGAMLAVFVSLVILLPLSFIVVLVAVIRLICSTLHSAVFDLAVKRLSR